MKDMLLQMLQKYGVPALLFVVLLVVWTQVMMSIYSHVEPGSSPEPVVHALAEFSQESRLSAELLEEDFNDPFNIPASLFTKANVNKTIIKKPERVQPRIAEQQEIPLKMPAFILNGITGDTATLEDEHGMTYIVGKGDSVLSFIVMSVWSDSVRVKGIQQTVTLKLES